MCTIGKAPVVDISTRPWLSAHKRLVYNIRVSQSSVGTRLRCGGNVSNTFIAHHLQSVPVKELLKSVTIYQRCQSCGKDIL